MLSVIELVFGLENVVFAVIESTWMTLTVMNTGFLIESIYISAPHSQIREKKNSKNSPVILNYCIFYNGKHIFAKMFFINDVRLIENKNHKDQSANLGWNSRFFLCFAFILSFL